eukprot:UN16817
MGGLMTCSCFSAEARRNRALARQANQHAKQEATVQKLLLLGAGNIAFMICLFFLGDMTQVNSFPFHCRNILKEVKMKKNVSFVDRTTF